MKLLHIALNNARQTALCNALASLGEYEEIDWIAVRQKEGAAGLQQHILHTCNWFHPDVVFMQLQSAGVVELDTLRNIPGFKINWTGDVRQPLPQWYIDTGREVDLSLFTNTWDVEAMRSLGLNADYLQIGFDPEIYCKGEPVDKTIDIVFMANHYGLNAYPNSQLRYDVAHALHKRYGKRFALYGGSWDLPASYVQHGTKAACEVYQRAKIAINLSHFDLSRYSSDRIHSIMASGCFCLTKYYPDMEQEFMAGKNIGVWHSIGELVEDIDFYLDNDSLRETIARRGYDLVHSRDTWAHRIENDLKPMLKI